MRSTHKYASVNREVAGKRTGAAARRAAAPFRERADAAQALFAISRSLNFWILPVEVLGISANTKWRGHL